MIEKKELLECLTKNLILEEEINIKLSDFIKALGWRRVVKQQYHSTIDSGLTKIKKDSEVHADIINKMIKYVEESEKNEF